MRIGFVKLIVVGVLGLFWNNAFANITVPFELVNGLIIVQAEMNGKIGNYIVDSGSNGILLNGSSEDSDVSYQTLSSTLEGSEMKIESFRVGEFELAQLLGFSTDLSNLEVYLEKPIDGILGCAIFNPNSLLFDFASSKMIISEALIDESEVEGFNHLDFYIFEDLPMVNIKIADKKHSFILDSGATAHFIDTSILSISKISARRTGNLKNIVTAGGKDKKSAEFKISNCRLGTVNSYDMDAYEKDFSEISATLNKKISGLLSVSKLCENKVYFDLKTNKIYFN